MVSIPVPGGALGFLLGDLCIFVSVGGGSRLGEESDALDDGAGLAASTGGSSLTSLTCADLGADEKGLAKLRNGGNAFPGLGPNPGSNVDETCGCCFTSGLSRRGDLTLSCAGVFALGEGDLSRSVGAGTGWALTGVANLGSGVGIPTVVTGEGCCGGSAGIATTGVGSLGSGL